MVEREPGHSSFGPNNGGDRTLGMGYFVLGIESAILSPIIPSIPYAILTHDPSTSLIR